MINIIHGLFYLYVTIIEFLIPLTTTPCYILAFILSAMTWGALIAIIMNIFYSKFTAPKKIIFMMEMQDNKQNLRPILEQLKIKSPNEILNNVPRNTSFYGSNDEQYYFLQEEYNKSLNLIKDKLDLKEVDEFIDVKTLTKSLFNSNIEQNLKKLESGLSISDKSYLGRYIPFPYIETKNMIIDMNKNIELIKDELDGYKSDIAISKKGIIGEKSVYNDLRLYENRYNILSNIRIEVDKKSSESDVIIISEKGIFIIEVKNYGKSGETIKIAEDGTWTKSSDGYTREVKDAVDQNKYHCYITNKLLNNELKKRGYDDITEIKCISIVCIANNEVDLRNFSNEIIVRASNIIPTIKNYKKNDNLSPELQLELKRILIENSLTPILYPVNSRNNKIDVLADNLKKLTLAIKLSQDIYIKYYEEVLKLDTNNILNKGAR